MTKPAAITSKRSSSTRTMSYLTAQSHGYNPPAPTTHIETVEWPFVSATKVCESTDWKQYLWLDTLAAAHAENGEFDEAQKWQLKAIDLAPAHEKAELHARLELYKTGQPFREEPKK